VVAWGAFALVALLAGSGCAQEPRTWAEYTESLPPLQTIPHESSHTLRVLYLEDPRLPKLDEKQRETLYRKIEILLAQWYSFKVDLVEVGAGDLRERFEKAAPVFETPLAKDFISRNAIDLGGFGSKDSILSTIREDLARRDEKLIRRYVKLKPGATKDDAAAAVFAVFEDRLTRLRETPVGEEGKDILHSARYADTQSFSHWEVFLGRLADADFVLSNSVIAGPDTAMPLYVAVRGGITNGFVTNSKKNDYRAVGVVGALPFLSDAPFFLEERGKIPQREKLDTLATFWMHELGHFFLRMKEHYGEGGCVHVAPEGLRVYEWHRAVRKAQNTCRFLPEERLTLY